MSPLIHREFLTPDEMEQLAGELRNRVDWSRIPVDPFAIAARLQINVLLGSFEDENVEGVLRTKGGQPEILIRESSSLARQKFTVAHELGHHQLHWIGEPEPREDQENFVDDDMLLYRRGPDAGRPTNREDRNREIQANMFASALLMPKDDVLRYARDMKSVRAMASAFDVSEVAMRYRIGELDVWTE